jgi:hypothetical protein
MEPKLEIVDGASAGAWVGPALGGEFGSVSRHVPRGYEAYARVFHPAYDKDGRPIRWREVASASGAITHREMQWHAILGHSEPEEPNCRVGVGGDGEEKDACYAPSVGGMDDATLDAVCELIGKQTRETSQCYFGLSVIQGWLELFPIDMKLVLRLPYARDYVVLKGALTAMKQLAVDSLALPSGGNGVAGKGGGGVGAQAPWAWIVQRGAPNLMWPVDRSWFIASEVDFDSTLVGGDAALIEAMVESSGLEAWRVDLTDSLAADADKINDVGA